MNRRQKITFIIGAMLLSLVVLFPPWLRTFSLDRTHSEKAIECSFLFAPPAPASPAPAYGVKIDIVRLGAELIAVSSLTTVAALIFGGFRSKS
jgi:hypothetical protein